MAKKHVGSGESEPNPLTIRTSIRYNKSLPAGPPMALKESEAIILRTYPLREADLLVTFYEDRERQELCRLDACEVLESPLASEVSYARAVALAHIAELLDELLPDREANDAVFRLTLSVLSRMRGPVFWMPVTYFDLWLTRLVGFLPDFSECVVCGRVLNGSRAYFHALADGLMCVDDKRLASSEMSSESRALAAQMFRAPVESFAAGDWPRAKASDLRKFLMQTLQRHIEKKLVTAGMLEKISS